MTAQNVGTPAIGDAAGPNAIADDEGGDAACWLNRVCDSCGAMMDEPRQPVCPRCGARLVDGEREAPSR